MRLTSTISAIELFWTVVCAFGLVFCFRRFNRAVELLEYLRAKGLNEYREYAVATKVISYGAYTFVQVAFVIIGIVAMLIPPAKQGQTAPLSFVIGLGFILISIILALSAYILDSRDVQLENKILRELKRREEADARLSS